jgi:hypothetical protein
MYFFSLLTTPALAGNNSANRPRYCMPLSQPRRKDNITSEIPKEGRKLQMYGLLGKVSTNFR